MNNPTTTTTRPTSSDLTTSSSIVASYANGVTAKWTFHPGNWTNPEKADEDIYAAFPADYKYSNGVIAKWMFHPGDLTTEPDKAEETICTASTVPVEDYDNDDSSITELDELFGQDLVQDLSVLVDPRPKDIASPPPPPPLSSRQQKSLQSGSQQSHQQVFTKSQPSSDTPNLFSGRISSKRHTSIDMTGELSKLSDHHIYSKRCTFINMAGEIMKDDDNNKFRLTARGASKSVNQAPQSPWKSPILAKYHHRSLLNRDRIKASMKNLLNLSSSED